MKNTWLYMISLTAIFIAVQAFVGPSKPHVPMPGGDALRTKVSLGKSLFFDPILSGDRTISCASCHKEKFAFSDTSVLSLGVSGKKGVRNTPSAMNVSDQTSFFWDGRSATLAQQALVPIANPVEMDLPVDSALARLDHSKFYHDYFQEVFNALPDSNNLGAAIADFEKTLETANTPYDDWQINDNERVVSASAKRGFKIFNTKGKCVICHFGGDFNSGGEFRNIGLFDGFALKDSGRAAITGKAEDLGKFKVPNLRNIALTAPYMHNGIFRTLKEVIDFYNDPDKKVPHSINRDSTLSKPLGLTDREKADLENFLRSLTDRRFAKNAK